MNDWVQGPLPLTEQTIDVFEGSICVILRNGEVYDVRGPGRHGGFIRLLNADRRLPVSGSLTVLTFERAPAVSQKVGISVRLLDGATVEVEMQAAIVPLWQEDPAAVKDVVRRYGVQPARIQEMAQVELEESMRVMARESLGALTHAQVHRHADARTLMKLPAPKGLLTVGRLVSCSIRRDPHEEASMAAIRDGELNHLREAVEAGVARLRATNRNGVNAIQRRGELAGRMETAAAESEINATIGKILGVPAVDVAYPNQRDARLRAQYQTVRGVLENNMDLLPLLADPAYAGATEGLVSLISGMFPKPGHVAAQTLRPTLPAAGEAAPERPPSSPAGRGSIRLLRRASTVGPTGTLEVQLLEEGHDRIIGAVNADGPARIMIRNSPDPVDVAMRALSAAATWCGVQVGARVVSPANPSSTGRIALTRVEAGTRQPHAAVEQALGAWIVAINRLLDGTASVHVDAGSTHQRLEQQTTGGPDVFDE